MNWKILFCDDFEGEFLALNSKVRVAMAAHITLIESYGPQLNRPHVDTLEVSQYSNMKELRFSVDRGVWRVAFAFDPKRQAILLVAGDKAGADQKRFYKKLIKISDQRFSDWLTQQKDN